MRIWLSVELLALCCLTSFPAHADDILLGASATAPGGFPVSIYAAEAEGFYLTQPVRITGIDAAIYSDTGYSSDLFLFQLTDRIGPSAGSEDILASLLAPRGLFAVSPCGDVYPSTICRSTQLLLPPLNLDPGEYFLVGAEVSVKEASLGARWQAASTVLPSAVGGVGPTFFTGSTNLNNPASSNWTAYTNNQLLDFRLLGVANGEVPAPSSAILLATGLLVALAISMTKRPARN